MYIYYVITRITLNLYKNTPKKCKEGEQNDVI